MNGVPSFRNARLDATEDERPRELAAVSRSLLGFALRPAQERSALAVLDGRDTLAVLATGSGKSAIYQVAGIAIGGLTLVVSPLIALQRDQVRSLTTRRHGVRRVGAALLNSAQRAHERQDALERIARGDLDFLFVGPEQRFRIPDALKLADRLARGLEAPNTAPRPPGHRDK